jgi:hypothetical protein
MRVSLSDDKKYSRRHTRSRFTTVFVQIFRDGWAASMPCFLVQQPCSRYISPDTPPRTPLVRCCAQTSVSHRREPPQDTSPHPLLWIGPLWQCLFANNNADLPFSHPPCYRVCLLEILGSRGIAGSLPERPILAHIESGQRNAKRHQKGAWW